MDDLCRWDLDGRHHAGGCDVPAVAARYAVGRVVFEYFDVGVDWAVFRHCGFEAYLLYCDYCGGESGDLGVPAVVRGCWICKLPLCFCLFVVLIFLCLCRLSRLYHYGNGIFPRRRAVRRERGRRGRNTRASQARKSCTRMEVLLSRK